LVGYLETPLKERFCFSHRDMPACRLCRAPGVVRSGANVAYCDACAADAVNSQDGVKQIVPRIRLGMSDMGIVLAHRVRVRLMSQGGIAALGARELGVVNGLTRWNGRTVVEIAVVSGLPPAKFGMTVAHETMHAWMFQEGFPPMLTPMIAEGLCQLAAFRWLKDCADRGASLLRTAIENNPDPIYGDGFRVVRASAKRHGLSRVLSVVRQTGQLP
jgi:hypothetical protein